MIDEIELDIVLDDAVAVDLVLLDETIDAEIAMDTDIEMLPAPIGGGGGGSSDMGLDIAMGGLIGGLI